MRRRGSSTPTTTASASMCPRRSSRAPRPGTISNERAEVADYDDSVWDHLLAGTTTPPSRPAHGQVAVKVIDDRGNESSWWWRRASPTPGRDPPDSHPALQTAFGEGRVRPATATSSSPGPITPARPTVPSHETAWSLAATLEAAQRLSRDTVEHTRGELRWRAKRSMPFLSAFRLLWRDRAYSGSIEIEIKVRRVGPCRSSSSRTVPSRSMSDRARYLQMLYVKPTS